MHEPIQAQRSLCLIGNQHPLRRRRLDRAQLRSDGVLVEPTATGDEDRRGGEKR
jgi:hypothetical protein